VADMTTQAELLASTTAVTLEFDDSKAAFEVLAVLKFRPQVRAAAVYDARGRVFAVYSRNAAETKFPDLPEADGMRVTGHDLVVYTRVLRDREILGTVYL